MQPSILAYCRRLTLASPGYGVSVLFDASQRSREAAAWNIWLSLLCIGILLAAVQLQMVVVSAALLNPLARMLVFLREQADHVLQSVQMPVRV